MRRRVRWFRSASWVGMTCATICFAGCQDPRGPARVSSDDPDLKIVAIKNDVATQNKTHLDRMVEGLQSDDAAVRFYCVEGLRRLTHDDFGYHYYETDDQRAPALARWQNWLKRQKRVN